MEFLTHLDPTVLIESFGYVGLFAVIFAESGLFIGFFFPGDSLLFTAGILASQGLLNIFVLVPLLFIAAVSGDSFGYAFGKRVGRALFTREDSWLLHKDHIERARVFYERYGTKTLIIARFTPIVRTLAPILAGVGHMHYRTFLTYNIIGALLWSVGVTLLGYFLGQIVPDIERFIIPLLVIIVVVSFFPAVIEVWKARKKRQR